MATRWDSTGVHSLGIAPGGLFSDAEAINSAGRICGSADDGDGRPLGCVFENGTANIIDTGGNNSRALFVATTGEVVGDYARGFGTTWLPVIWTEDPRHAGRYDQTFLPLFQDPAGVDSYDYIFDANNSLQCVGQVSSTLWSARGGYWHNDAAHTLTLLEPLPNQWDSYANSINAQGTIVGVSDVGSLSTTPTIWSAYPAFVPSALPLLPGEVHGSATKINDLGTIIGWHGADQRPAIWSGNKIYDLQSLVAGSLQGWTLDSLSDINNKGEIIGYGHKNGQWRGFVLRPMIKAIGRSS